MPQAFKVGLKQWKPHILNAKGLSSAAAARHSPVQSPPDEWALSVAPLTMRGETRFL